MGILTNMTNAEKTIARTKSFNCRVEKLTQGAPELVWSGLLDAENYIDAAKQALANAKLDASSLISWRNERTDYHWAFLNIGAPMGEGRIGCHSYMALVGHPKG